MSTALGVLLAVLVLAVVVAGLLSSPAVRRRRLRERFGPTYERAVADEGDRRSAEQRLAAIAKRRGSLDIRPLPERDRQSFLARWNEIQPDFVDHPVSATGRADELIKEVVHACGYPVEDFGNRADLLAADHPQAAETYREADALRKRNAGHGGAVDTEELRAALVHYRSVFEQLVGLGTTRDPWYAHLDATAARPVARAGRDPSG